MADMKDQARAAGKFKDNLKEAKKTQDEIKSSLNDILFEQRNLADEARGFAKGLFESSTQATATSAAFRGIANITKNINASIEDVVTGTKTLGDLSKDLEQLRQKELSLNIELQQALSKSGYAQEDINRVLTGQIGTLDLIEESNKDISDAAFDLLELYDNQLGTLKDQKEEYAGIKEIAQRIDDNMGIAGKATEGLSGVLNKLGAGDIGKKLGLDEAIGAGRKEAAELANASLKAGKASGGIGDKFKVAGKMAQTVGKSLLKALGPVTLIAELFKGLMAADKQTKEIGRSMMMTKTEAAKFSGQIANATRSNFQFGVTSTKVLENITKVNQQFGFINEFSGETLVTMTKLTYTLGIGAEAAGNLALAAEATGVNFEDNYENILATSYELQQQAGTQVDLRSVLEDTGKITGQLRANFGGNTVEIAKAVTNAKLLGTEIETIASAGKQLLDFESSITSELEAELLLGRDINLERARAAALTGDQLTLQNELAREMGSFEDFAKMNVIQQEALASALGMSTDAIADMLFEQETMNKSVKELRDLGKDELANRLEQKSAQDKMNAAMNELKEVFVQLGTALSPILSLVSFLAGAVSTVIGFTMDLLNILNPFNNAFSKDYQSQGIAAGKNFLGIDDGVIGPSGKIISTSPDDFLIATKNPQQMASNVAQSGPTVDTSRLESLLEASLKQTPPTPIIKMNDVKLGTAVDMGAFSIQ